MRSSPARKNSLLIVARSARPLAAMARAAGFEVHAIDLFGDQDTRLAARYTTALTPTRQFDFKAAELLGAIAAHQSLHGPMPVVCGSAFERAPTLLANIARHYHVIACDAEVYRRLWDLPALFASLRRTAGIATPATSWHAPAVARGWLCKRVGGTGGYHVAAVSAATRARHTHYFQQRVDGASCSALFIANGRDCRYYGCAEHLRWHAASSYRYEGARRLLHVPAKLRASLELIGAVLTARLALRGCFGIDFLRREDDRPVLVDINPRPTASLELWPARQRMFSAHLAACTDQTLLYSSPQATTERAHLVLYADAPWQVPDGLDWSPWIVDRPCAGTFIARGAPLCTLLGVGASSAELAANLQRRYQTLRTRIGAPAQALLPATIDIRTR